MIKTDIDATFSREDLDLIYEIMTSIYAISDFDEMLRIVLLKIKEVFKIEGASLALHEPDQKLFYFIRTVEMQRDGKHDDIEKMHFPDHLGVAGWVLRKNETVMIRDVSNDDRVYQDFDLAKNLSHRSMVCVPLRTPRSIVGVLYAIHKSENYFSEKDSQLLEVLCVGLAMAIENSKNYGALRKYANSLEEEKRRLISEVQNLFELRGVIASSPSMRRLFDLIGKVIDTRTTILLQGETGSGKELIAKVIHYNGPFKDKPFVAENCGALSENLLESELFGHVRGAFTGAVSDKKGLFAMADGGTVLLDEIGEMPPSMQVKFLRILQEGQFRPVGGSRFFSVNSNFPLAFPSKSNTLYPTILSPSNTFRIISLLIWHWSATASSPSQRPLAINHSPPKGTFPKDITVSPVVTPLCPSRTSDGIASLYDL